MAELGIVGDAPHVVVDTAGALGRIGEPLALEWGIGADDRWHFASSEPAVRQQLADDETAIETRLRIPSGDAVQRVVVVPAAGSAVARAEVENDSPVPVALAVVLRVGAGAISVADDTVLVDDTPVFRAGRSIARVVAAGDAQSARAQVESGAAQPPAEQTWPRTGSAVGLVFPLPHTAVIRFVYADAGLTGLPTPDELPPLDAVARGWDAHLDPAMQVSIPDQRLSRALLVARRHLLSGSALGAETPFWTTDVAPWVPAIAAVALDVWGHRLEAREFLLAASGVDDLAVHATRPPAAAGALLWAWAERLERQPDPELEAALLPWIEEVAIGLLAKRGWVARRMGKTTVGDEAWRAVGLASAGSLLTRAGSESLGPDIVDALPQFLSAIDPEASHIALALGANRLGLAPRSVARVFETRLGLPSAEGGLGDVATRADAVGAIALGHRSQHPEASALLLLAARRTLAAEPEGTGGVVALVPDPDPSWLGAPIEVHRAPVTAGLLSFGIRWHDDRPALLWDLEPQDAPSPANGDWSVSCPSLDPAWSDDRVKGEALLAPTVNLNAEPTPESAQVRRGEQRIVDDEPDSFQ